MDFALNEDQSMLRDGIERFLADCYSFENRRQRLGASTATDRDLWERFAELGWFAILVPEVHGGLGWSLQEACLALAETSKALVAEPVLDVFVATAMLVATGNAAAMKVLPEIVTGTCIAVPAFLEAGQRYDLGKPSTRLDADGTLTGRKIMVAAGDVADQFLVPVRYKDALAVALVPGDAPGVVRRPYRLLDGSWAADIVFDGVSLSDSAILAAGPDAERILALGMDVGALGVAAQHSGAIDQMIALTNSYLHARKQFGQELAKFQVLQHRLSDMFVEGEMARSAVHGAISVLGNSQQAASAMVSAARVRSDDAVLNIGKMCIHLHGGMGMTMEYPIGHFYRRAVMLARTYGDSAHHLARYEAMSFAKVA